MNRSRLQSATLGDDGSSVTEGGRPVLPGFRIPS